MPIKEWYCTCKVGKRTVGTCSHVASVIWYLSNARYNSTKSKKFTIEKIFPDFPTRDSSDEYESDTTIVEESNSWENEWLTPESDSATIPDTRFQTQPDQNMFAPSTSTQTTTNQNMVAPSIRPKTTTIYPVLPESPEWE